VQVNRNCEINIEETVVLPPSEKTEDRDNPQLQDLKLWKGDSQFELLSAADIELAKPCLTAYAHCQHRTSRRI